jgi:hypothetical protein
VCVCVSVCRVSFSHDPFCGYFSPPTLLLTLCPSHRCVCPPLYELNQDGFSCRPLCPLYGCVRGTCVAPNTCQCALGWTGPNCSVDCGCNFHSTCNTAGPGTCDQCRDNSAGSRCELCASNFFGNASNGGQCLTCNATCNGHSTSCSVRNGQVFCSNCSGNTIGRLCDICDTGYFLDPTLIVEARRRGLTPRQYVDTTAANVSCVPCMCNMHATTCNADTGEGCPCGDNTFTRAQDCPAAGCYGSQCAACLPTVSINHVDLQLDGYPINGHMCFLVPSGDATFDLAIGAGEVQPFLIVPRYTNVDIRIAIDLDTARSDQLLLQISTDSNITRNMSGVVAFRTPPFYSNTFRGRLSLAISSDDFDFDEDHFYVIIRSASPTTVSYRATFLQPLVSIDLFVFFAVFFSSFFLFLALVAISFKIKTRFEERAAQQAAVEQMEVRGAVCG